MGEGINLLTKESVAMKFEEKNIFNFLEIELFHLMKLQGFGIPKIISFGKNKKNNILIEELLVPGIDELFDLREKMDKKTLLKAVCLIAIQSLDRLQFIHSKNFIHRDIKPSNLLIGNKDKTIIYLIDFGLSGKYRSDKTGKHIKYKFVQKAFGTFKYMSLNSINGYELSRRDDLESLGYSIIELAKNYLPWNSANSIKIDKKQVLKEVLKIKISTTPEKLCEGLPKEFLEYIKYVKKLLFEQGPDYSYMKSLFISYLTRNELSYDNAFFWAQNLEKKNQDKINIMGSKATNKSITSYRNRGREKTFQRLYNQIKKSLDKRNNISTSHFNFSIKSMETLGNLNKNLNNNKNKNNNYQCKDNRPLKIKVYTPINKIINTNINHHILFNMHNEKYRKNYNRLIKKIGEKLI